MDRLLNASDLRPVAKGQAYQCIGDEAGSLVKFHFYRDGVKHGIVADAASLKVGSSFYDNAASIATDAGVITRWTTPEHGEGVWETAVPSRDVRRVGGTH